MKNTKLIALLVAVATVSVISAGYYENGVYHHGFRPVSDTGYAAGRVVEGTGDAVEGAGRATGRAVEGTTGFVGNVLGVGRRQERRQQRDYENRMNKANAQDKLNEDYSNRIKESRYTN